jgi:hypothetical protein
MMNVSIYSEQGLSAKVVRSKYGNSYWLDLIEGRVELLTIFGGGNGGLTLDQLQRLAAIFNERRPQEQSLSELLDDNIPF